MSQLNFFLTDSDFNQRIDEVLSSNSFLLFDGRYFDIPQPKSISSPSDLKQLDCITWLKNEYSQPVCQIKCSGPVMGKYRFDNYLDPIVEISKPFINSEQVMLPGRIYYKDGWIKNEELRKAHEKATRKIRRIFNADLIPVSPPFKMSKTVKNLVQQGLILELGAGGKQCGFSDLSFA